MSSRFPDIYAHALQVPAKPEEPWLPAGIISPERFRAFHCKREFKKPRRGGRCDLSKFLPGECIFIAAAMPCEKEDTNE